MDEEFWWRDAICQEIGTDLFFAEGPGNVQAAAKQACRICPVRLQCLADELTHEDQGMGVFGGFGRDARRLLRKRVERGQRPREVAIVAIAHEKAKRVA